MLLSRHNTEQGYPNNLAIEDVEYILQKYATDVVGSGVVQFNLPLAVDYPIGYDVYNGWGLLNIGTALKMVNAPKYKIVHPINVPIRSSTRVIRSNFQVSVPETLNDVTTSGNYMSEVYEVIEEYEYHAPANFKILDAWRRLSSTVGFKDTLMLDGDPWADFQFNINATQDKLNVTSKTYYYKLRRITFPDNPNNPISWVPDNLAFTNKMKYSVHLENMNTVGMSDVIMESKNIQIYPNPSNDGFHIKYQFDGIPEQLELTVFNLLGQQVYGSKLVPRKAAETYFDATHLAAGNYMVRLTTHKNSFFKKVIKL